MRSDQKRGGLAQDIEIERALDIEREIAQVRYLPRDDAILIDLARRGKARGEVRLDRLDKLDREVAVEHTVQPKAKFLRRITLRETGVRDLPEGMDARVGSPRAGDRDRRIEDRAKAGLDLALHSSPRGLYLPAREARSVVGDCQLPVLHKNEDIVGRSNVKAGLA